MTLTRWNRNNNSNWYSFRQLSTLREQIDRLFELPVDSLTQGAQQFQGGWSPALDLYENGDQFIVKVELPGINKDEIGISLHEDVLSLIGERSEEQKREDAGVIRAERFNGRFHRTISLPAPVDASKVKAVYQDGILTVTLPKTEEAKPKQITIKLN